VQLASDTQANANSISYKDPYTFLIARTVRSQEYESNERFPHCAETRLRIKTVSGFDWQRCPIPGKRTRPGRALIQDDKANPLTALVLGLIWRGWRVDCLIQSMPNTTLAPEDDNSDFPRGAQFSPPPRVNPTEAKSGTQVLTFRFGLNSQTAGFEILPWPGVDPSARPKDSVAIAMKYLIDGKERRSREEKK
jgi:hypothetical protein